MSALVLLIWNQKASGL